MPHARTSLSTIILAQLLSHTCNGSNFGTNITITKIHLTEKNIDLISKKAVQTATFLYLTPILSEICRVPLRLDCDVGVPRSKDPKIITFEVPEPISTNH